MQRSERIAMNDIPATISHGMLTPAQTAGPITAVILLVMIGGMLSVGPVAAQPFKVEMPMVNKTNYPSKNMHVTMMRSTVRLVGNGAVGTGFILGKPTRSNPARGHHVLVTAAHVFEKMTGEEAILEQPVVLAGDQWAKRSVPIRIRNNEGPLWKKHPDADAASIFVSIPSIDSFALLSTDALMDDSAIGRLEIGPGSELHCLGYPYGIAANDYGFAILRSGRVASYPLIPTRREKTFLFDFSVFGGNSGGPVYVVTENPIIGGTLTLGGRMFGILGLVTAQSTVTRTTQTDEFTITQTQVPLQIGIVVHSSLIRDLIDSMGYPPEP